MPITQENRMLRIETPLDDNALVLSSFFGTEGLCVPFSYELNLVSESDAISFDGIVGENISFSIGSEEAEARFFNGIVSRFSQDRGAGEGRLACYSATVVPWFWLLSKTTNSRIYQDKSVPEIVEELFAEKGFNDFRMELSDGAYEPKTYCVQYAETDFNFVSRLLEQEGIFYFFEHENGNHTMVIGDSPSHHPQCPLNPSVIYRSGSMEGSQREVVVSDLDKWQEIRIGKYTVNDFNFESPNNDLLIGVENQISLGPGEREVYEYPAEYKTRAEGERLANIRMQAEEVRATSFSGSGTCPGFTGGHKYTLSQGHYREEMNGQAYVLTSVTHSASEPAGGSGGGGGGFIYSNKFTCVPFEVPYRPAFITPKPMIPGVQTAIVVGPSGEQIHTDEHGRVKVQFLWDRSRQFNEDSSCWIRVCQSLAGAGWGAMFLPRIGQEVVVSFLEGDPDRPIITGSVYNGLNTPPYALPDERTKSTIKTISVPDNGGTNEIRFEDKADEEQLFIQAQKTFDTRVKDKSREYVGEKRHLIVVEDQLEKTDGDKHLTIGGDHKEKVDGVISIEAQGDFHQKAGPLYAVESGQEVHIKAGMSMVLEAGMDLTLKGAGGFVKIDASGVTIQGNLVKINSGGSPGSGSGCSPDFPDQPEEADMADLGRESELPSLTPEEVEATELTPQAITFREAAENGAPFCDT